MHLKMNYCQVGNVYVRLAIVTLTETTPELNWLESNRVSLSKLPIVM